MNSAHDVLYRVHYYRRGRFVSVYQASNGTRFWIITDAGWETTTLLPSEDY